MRTFGRRLLAGCLSPFIAIPDVSALEGPGRALTASDVLKLSANTTRSGLGVSKQFIVPYAGTVRVKYQFRSDGNGTVSVAVATAAENSVAACSASTSVTSFQTKVCDLRVVAGDRVQVFGSGFFDPGTFEQSTIFLRNVRLFWNVVDSTGLGVVLTD